MKIQINSLDNGSGTYPMLEIYRIEDKFNNTEMRPIAKIWEDDFCKLLSDKQIDKLYNGKINWNIDKTKLAERVKDFYPNFY